jgi:hypothetical protein
LVRQDRAHERLQPELEDLRVWIAETADRDTLNSHSWLSRAPNVVTGLAGWRGPVIEPTR